MEEKSKGAKIDPNLVILLLILLVIFTGFAVFLYYKVLEERGIKVTDETKLFDFAWITRGFKRMT